MAAVVVAVALVAVRVLVAVRPPTHGAAVQATVQRRVKKVQKVD
ncbi:MAG: hypothetical protein R2689_10835 [Microthrixaceae bacterium]